MEIDIRDDMIVINGTEIGAALSIEELKAALGEPRVLQTEPDKNYREYMEKRRGKDYFETSRSLVWDEAGIYSHTVDGKTLASFGLVFNNSKKTAVHTPKSNFSGKLTINGEDWLSAVKKGKDMFGNYCKLTVKSFVLFAEYKPEKMPLSERTENDFTLIEMTHTY